VKKKIPQTKNWHAHMTWQEFLIPHPYYFPAREVVPEKNSEGDFPLDVNMSAVGMHIIISELLTAKKYSNVTQFADFLSHGDDTLTFSMNLVFGELIIDWPKYSLDKSYNLFGVTPQTLFGAPRGTRSADLLCIFHANFQNLLQTKRNPYFRPIRTAPNYIRLSSSLYGFLLHDE
jgi:hypothetical protein